MHHISKYQASVHYNDWKGSAAADNADLHGLQELLSKRELVSNNEPVVYFKAQFPRAQAPYFSISAYALKQSATDNEPLQVRKVGTFELSPDEFFGLFKRFEIALELKDFHAVEYEGSED